MELQQLIEQFNEGSGSEKTAAEEAPATGAEGTTTEDLKGALGEVLESGQQKEAAAAEGNPVDDLMKMASELTDLDKEAEEASVRNLGVAFADSAHRRWNELNEKVGNVLETSPLADAVKLAAQQGHADASAALQQGQQKEASAEEKLQQIVKLAEAGDAEAQAYLQKLAAAEYEEGQKAALQEAHKTASAEFLKGAAEVQVLVKLSEQQPQQ
jgi:hypothetical protein